MIRSLLTGMSAQGSKEKTSDGTLARALSGDSACPVPNAHDKTNEAHYFLHEMMDHYHDCDRFRYSLSAYLQAARSITLMLQADLTHREGFGEWYGAWQKKMADNADLKLLNSERVRVVHRESLVPASTMFFGAFELGKEKMGFAGFPLDPMQDSVPALIETRALFEKGMGKYHFLDPYRTCNCEEYGLTRKWSLPALNGTELTDFCTKTFAALVEVVSDVHKWCGARYETEVTCNHRSKQYRALRESQIFPEVARAWEMRATERVLPRGKELPLRIFPFDESSVIYTLTPKRAARGWVSITRSPYWPQNYASMLIYSLGGRCLRLRNSVFFDHTLADIQPTK